MSDYRELVKTEARKFFEANREAFQGDEGEHGGKSGKPNISRWIDRTTRLNKVVEDVSSRWTHKDYLWVQRNTRSWNTQGGDPRSNAFGAFYRDVLQEIKKLWKA